MKDSQVWKAYTPELQVRLINERGEIGLNINSMLQKTDLPLKTNMWNTQVKLT